MMNREEEKTFVTSTCDPFVAETAVSMSSHTGAGLATYTNTLGLTLP